MLSITVNSCVLKFIPSIFFWYLKKDLQNTPAESKDPQNLLFSPNYFINQFLACFLVR
jgi:hypothetical protein